MSWWTPSWLGFPNLDFALPSTLQRRFISYLLKRFLGPFLKPGQLDVHQIDSQIVSGYLQVKNLEIDEHAVNALLSDFPLEVREGFVGSVTAQIPWPNPMSGNLRISLSSLRLTLHLVSRPQSETKSHADLTESVMSVAGEFVHNEMSPGEEEILMKSVHEEMGAFDENVVPGGLDPFEDPEQQQDINRPASGDPVGISLFAGLLQRLLLRFEVVAEDTQITIVHPGHSEYTVSFGELLFNHQQNEGLSTQATSTQSRGAKEETRLFQLSGFSISCRNLDTDPAPHEIVTGEKTSVHSPTTSTSGSDYDEVSHALMSQSFATLPPRTTNLDESVDVESSALFQSAMSTLPEVPEIDHSSRSSHNSGLNCSQPPTRSETSLPQSNFEADTLCSITSEPLVVQMTISLPTASPTYTAHTSTSANTSVADASQFRSVSVSVSMGTFACALKPWHVASFMELLDQLSSSSSSTTVVNQSAAPASSPIGVLQATSSYLDEVDVNVRIRAMVLLAIPTCKSIVRDSSFFKKPLQPSTLSSGYARVCVETITVTGSASTKASSPLLSVNSPLGDASPPSLHLHARLLVADLSILTFSAPTSNASEHRILPILITDHSLSSQYGEEHEILPSLSDGLPLRKTTVDLPLIPSPNWLSRSQRATQLRISQWRSRPNARNRHSYRSSVDTARHGPNSPQSYSPRSQVASPGSAKDSTAQPTPALSVSIDGDDRSMIAQGPSTRLSVELAPLHAFFNVEGLVQGSTAGEPSHLLAFIRDVSERSDRLIPQREQKVDVDVERDAPRSPVAHMGRLRTFEQHAIDDLGLTMDYGSPKPSDVLEPTRRPTNTRQQTAPELALHAPMVRIEVRTSPRDERSGALIVDVHALSVHSSPPEETGLHFANEADAPALAADSNHIMSVDWRRALVAISLPARGSASAFVSVGPLGSDNISRPRLRRLPRVDLSSTALGTNSVLLYIPSVHADLSKAAFDALQLWADDCSKVMERALMKSSPNVSASTMHPSRDSGLIGSRYFLQQKRGSQDSEPNSFRAQSRTKTSGQTVVKVEAGEIFARLRLPTREDDNPTPKPLDVLASDLDVLLEIKPDGKDETLCTLSLADIAVLVPDGPSPLPIISLTSPRGFAINSRQFAHLRFKSSVVAGSSAKESQISVTLSGFTCNVLPDLKWIESVVQFAKPPAGVFEGVPPSEQTVVSFHVRDGSVRMFAPHHPGAFVAHIGELDFATVLASDNPNINCEIKVPSLSAFLTDDFAALTERLAGKNQRSYRGAQYWKKSKYTVIAEVLNAHLLVDRTAGPSSKLDATVDGIDVRVHLCADTGVALGAFFSDFGSIFQTKASGDTTPAVSTKQAPENVSAAPKVAPSQELMNSVDEAAFKANPEVGAAPDMIADDLPVNMDYLDESFGTAGGLREMTDDDVNEFDATYTPDIDVNDPTIISRVGGETIRILEPEDFDFTENHFNTLPAITEELPQTAEIFDCVKVQKAELTLFLYEGYDLSSTRRTIEHEIKEMKKRLAKIRQLVAEGQKYDPTIEEPSSLLFNSFYIGLKEDAEDMEADVLIGAIDEALQDDLDPETATQSSWQSLPAKQHQQRKTPSQPAAPKSVHGRRLTRASTPSIEFKLQGANVEYDRYASEEDLASRVFATVRDVEILDHVKTSTWRKFMTALRADSKGNIRETGSNMVRVEVQNIRPVSGNTTEEVRLRAKLLPLRLHVDQDALDFLKKFFSFKDPDAVSPDAQSTVEAYLQRAEVFPVGLKLDYKPRRVDYRALREGKTIELMNFFHFDGAEMTLRHITVYGVAGWPRFFDMLNDMWTPDVKATQLADVISGVAPIRSVVNVGSGVADLVLLPIAQYRKDGRIVRGMQKGTKSFVQSTAMEAVRLGARLATGTQVILEQTEHVLGSRQFDETLTGETLMIRDDFDENADMDASGDLEDALTSDPISRYAEQPGDVREGMQEAYAGMRRNLNSAAQTILAVPMEVYERSGNEGAVRAVIRAVPIAVLRPMIGASEAVSKALLGLQNSMDPNVRLENEAKYKHRS